MLSVKSCVGARSYLFHLQETVFSMHFKHQLKKMLPLDNNGFCEMFQETPTISEECIGVQKNKVEVPAFSFVSVEHRLSVARCKIAQQT